ncbi:MAG TPA: SEC-C metal-binding domain-containing protein [Planctomycetota bacterium]
MKSFTLTVVERRATSGELRLEAPGRTTLAKLVDVIARELGLAPGRSASIYRSGRALDQRTEFSSRLEAERPLRSVHLDRFALRAGSMFLLRYGAEPERWLELRVAAVSDAGEGEPGEGVAELCVVGREAPAARADLFTARLYDAMETPPPGSSPREIQDWLRRSHELASELLARGQAEIEALSDERGLDLASWLIDLSSDLARDGLVDEALGLAARAAEVLEHAELLADRAVILAEADRRDEALAQVEAVLAAPGLDAVRMAKCGDVQRVLGEARRAEELYRRALSLAKGEHEKELVLERLVDLLEDQGRGAEGRAFALATRGAQEWFGIAPPPAPGERDLLVPVPRVGRNEPCPCGSGKKYKKCCEREADARGELAFLTPGLDRALEHLLAEGPPPSLRAALARLHGPAFEGLELHEALPLLPHAGLEAALLDWWLMEREEQPGATLLDLYLARRGARLDPREKRVLARLGASSLGLYELEPMGPEPRLRARDLLGGRDFELDVEEVLASGAVGVQLLRLVEADSRTQAVHAGVSVRREHAAAVVAALGPRWAGLARAERAPALVQAWLDACHAAAPS